MPDPRGLTKGQLVGLVEQLRDDLMAANLRLASSGAAAGAAGTADVSSELAGWLAGLVLPPAASPVAALAHHLAARLALEVDDKAVAGVAKELRAAMAEIRELTAGADDDDPADDLDGELRDAVAGLATRGVVA